MLKKNLASSSLVARLVKDPVLSLWLLWSGLWCRISPCWGISVCCGHNQKKGGGGTWHLVVVSLAFNNQWQDYLCWSLIAFTLRWLWFSWRAIFSLPSLLLSPGLFLPNSSHFISTNSPHYWLRSSLPLVYVHFLYVLIDPCCEPHGKSSVLTGPCSSPSENLFLLVIVYLLAKVFN